jgi:class I fructose-bisphosphate aldolase
MIGRIQEILGSEADSLLNHQCKTISKDKLHLPGPDFVDRIFVPTDRPTRSLV